MRSITLASLDLFVPLSVADKSLNVRSFFVGLRMLCKSIVKNLKSFGMLLLAAMLKGEN